MFYTIIQYVLTNWNLSRLLNPAKYSPKYGIVESFLMELEIIVQL